MYRVSAGHSLTKLCGQNCDWAQLGVLFNTFTIIIGIIINLCYAY